MSTKSFIYRNRFIYRLVMNVLYRGRYNRRFAAVVAHLANLPKGTRILELCFGDIYIADFCKKGNFDWKGLDINLPFVKDAQRVGYDASHIDIAKLTTLPEAEICVIMGSLYHFYDHLDVLLRKIFKATNTLIISEPVSNLSTRRGLIGLIAKRSANVGKGNEEFRYTKPTLLSALHEHQSIGYSIITVEEHGKDIVIKLEKK